MTSFKSFKWELKERSCKMRKKTCESTDSHVSTKSSTSSVVGVRFCKLPAKRLPKYSGNAE